MVECAEMDEFQTERLAVEIIEWLDSNFTARWQVKREYEARMDDTMKCRSVGFVLHETDDRVCLLQSESPDCYSEMITIPKVSITKRSILPPILS